MGFRDLKRLLKNKSKIVLENKQNLLEDYWIFDFSIEKNTPPNHKKITQDITWLPGDYCLISFADKRVTKGMKHRYMSIVSTPQQGFIRLAMRIGSQPSAFKSCMANLVKGETMVMRGPSGSFHICDYQNPIVMLAGGIGITPMLAMIRHLTEETEQSSPAVVHSKVHLLYTTKGQPLFREDLETLATGNASIQLNFLQGRDAIHSAVADLLHQFSTTGTYYIAGPQGFCTDIKRKLRHSKIPNKRIFIDPFYGCQPLFLNKG